MIEKLIFSSIILSSISAHALESSSILSNKIQKSLMDRVPYAEIRLPNLDKLSKSEEISALKDVATVRVVEERGNGVAILDLTSSDAQTVRIQTPYQAMVTVPVANHKILPNQKIKKEDFRTETINVAISPAKEYRGSIVRDELKLENSETKQTILEGQFVLSTSIQRTPDLRKGETIKLQMTSGELSLTTAATVLESGSIGEQVRVLTSRTKKEVVGTVKIDHSVEVNL